MGTNAAFLNILKQHGVDIITASDAHRSEHVGTVSYTHLQCGYCKAIAHTWTKEAFQSFTHVVFTSAQVVHILMKQLQEAGFDSRILYQCKLCVMGKGTKKALAQYGLCADLMPNIHDSKHMAELLTASVQKQDHILLPKAVNGNTYLQKTLETQCKVSYVPLYTIEELPHSIQDEDYDGVLMTCPFSCLLYTSIKLSINTQYFYMLSYKFYYHHTTYELVVA